MNLLLGKMARSLALLVSLGFCPNAAHAQLTPPKLLKDVVPAYSPALQDAAVGGTVAVTFEVTTTGAVKNVKIQKSSGVKELDASALKAAKKLLFSPALDKGAPVSVEINYAFNFVPAEKIDYGRFTVTLVERGTRNKATGVRLTLTNQKSKEFSTVTDAQGVATFNKLPPGDYQITAAATGYKEFNTTQTIQPKEALAVLYRVERQSYDEYLTIIEEKRVEEVSRRVLRPKEIYKVAGTQGDPVRVIQNLPGVARGAFGSGQLSIRGAAPFESRFYFDDLEVPLLFHFGGLRTVYNGEVIDRVDFLPGGFTGRYGEAVGGIVSTYTRAPKNNRFHLLADINTYDSQLFIEGPVAKNVSFYASGRRSYIDLLLKALLKNRDGFSLLVAPRYYDYQTALVWQLNSSDKRTMQVYGSDDALEFLLDKPSDRDPSLRGTFKTNTSFHRLALHYEKRFGQGWSSTSRLGAGPTSVLLDTSNGPYFKLRVIDIGVRQEFTKEFTESFSLGFGANSEVTPYWVTARVPPASASIGGVRNPTVSTQLVDATEKGTQVQGGVFALSTLKTGPYTLIPSVRLDSGNTGSDLTVDPRFSARRKLSSLDEVKMAAGLYHQRPQPQESARTFGNPDLTSKYALQYVLGYERTVPWRALPLVLDVQGFYRDLHNQIVATTSNARYTNDGSGFAAGGELYLRYGLRESVNGWVSYTLSKSRLRSDDNSKLYPFQNDQTHILTVVGNVPLPRRWEFGFRWRYTTGNPFTPIVGSNYNANNDVYVPIRGALYSSRHPSFHQLDVRIEKRWVFDDLMLSAFLEINNLYNRKNVEAITYAFDYSKSESVTGLPIIPIFGVRGEF